jgi:hypothetical protein
MNQGASGNGKPTPGAIRSCFVCVSDALRLPLRSGIERNSTVTYAFDMDRINSFTERTRADASVGKPGK